MVIQAGIDTIPTLNKPDRENGGHIYGAIRKRAADNWKEMGLSEFADLVGNQGYAFVPGKLENGYRSDCCVEQQVFALDFDSGITLQTVKERCEAYSLSETIIYHTLSHRDHGNERFRVLFITEQPVQDSFVIKAIICMLLWIFPEADKACKDLARIFLGGRELVFYNEDARVSLVYLLDAFRKSLGRNGHYRRNAESFARDTGVMLWKEIPMVMHKHEIDGIFGEKRAVDFNIYRAYALNSPIFFVKNDPYIKLHQSDTCVGRPEKTGRRLNLNDVSEKCRLLEEFYSGTELSHEIKFCIARSLLYIKGGKTKFLETILKNDGRKKHEKWIYDLKVMNRLEYKPSTCKTFCPYYDGCGASTIIGALSDDHKIYLLHKEPYVSIEEAQEQFYENLVSAMNSGQEGIHLINGQTGLGKTELYIRMAVENPRFKIVIAVPTNKLKQEIFERMKRKGIPESDIFVTPSVRNNCFVPAEDQELVMDKHDSGIHNATKKIIKELLKKISKESIAQIDELKKIIAGVGAIGQERIIITTHAYLIHIPGHVFWDRTVIIDEDILQQFFNRTCQIDSESLRIISETEIQGYRDIAAKMLSAPCERYHELGQYRRYAMSDQELESLSERGCIGNYNDLYQARSFVRHKNEEDGTDIVQYFCPPSLPCMKAIVLSATVNPDVYRKYFSSQMILTYPEKRAPYKGAVEQYSYYSLGRRDLQERLEAFAFAEAFFDGENLASIITFKKHSNNLVKKDLTCTSLHFGNTMGVDELAGRNIAVIGTPFNHPDGDKLIATYLGANVNSRADQAPVRRRIEYGGYSFVLPVYKDPLLREIQLYRIQTELEQSVGRARLLRYDARVLVLSAFPVAQARIHIDRYLDPGEGDVMKENRN